MIYLIDVFSHIKMGIKYFIFVYWNFVARLSVTHHVYICISGWVTRNEFQRTSKERDYNSIWCAAWIIFRRDWEEPRQTWMSMEVCIVISEPRISHTRKSCATDSVSTNTIMTENRLVLVAAGCYTNLLLQFTWITLPIDFIGFRCR